MPIRAEGVTNIEGSVTKLRFPYFSSSNRKTMHDKDKNFGLASPDDWSELVQSVQNGNDDKLIERLFQVYPRFVDVLQKRYRADTDTARECVLDAMTVFRRLVKEKRPPQYNHMRSYLLRISITIFLKQQDKAKHCKMLSLEKALLNENAETGFYDAHTDILIDILLQAKTLLPPDQALLIDKRFNENKAARWDIIGKSLGIKPDAARKRAETAMNNLRRLFHKLYQEQTGQELQPNSF
jgi:DNA-directed RNA polymerase specialized sigma24 family protein